MPKLGTKNVLLGIYDQNPLFGYFWATNLKNYCDI